MTNIQNYALLDGKNVFTHNFTKENKVRRIQNRRGCNIMILRWLLEKLAKFKFKIFKLFKEEIF